ncbi:N-carbamoyl-D-amino-acid hydrolase [Bradyrhizobium sp. AZCC 2289]|uniref:N-carbamoyl-D-amino-acid hydrolase n=1 Tax=Bradyrhizobium sp. AZCC 2289 TaxID=3117026 RepID=UPI002FF1BB1F
MNRILRIAGAQMGPTQRADTRENTLARMISLFEQAASKKVDLVVFPELAFTTFFPRWLLSGPELDSYFEMDMPNPSVQPLFDCARRLQTGFYVGYAELTPDGRRFNTAIIVGKSGEILSKYRKVHLPGYVEPKRENKFQQLEKRYFEYGDFGFACFESPQFKNAVLGMLICNDRRWAEAWRVLGLQNVELVCIGYNSAAYDPSGGDGEDATLRSFHSKLVVQANAYMNATWAISIAKAGVEDGAGLIGGSCIVDPNGQIVAEALTLKDEIIVADCDLSLCRHGKDKMFNFSAHRRPQWYGLITEQSGTLSPSHLPGGNENIA